MKNLLLRLSLGPSVVSGKLGQEPYVELCDTRKLRNSHRQR